LEAKIELRKIGIGSTSPIQKKIFTLVGALLNNLIKSTFELDNSHSSTMLLPCARLSSIGMLKYHMGTSPIKKCPPLFVNDVDEDVEDINSKPAQHNSPSKVANPTSSIDEKDMSVAHPRQ
jgi:hypothetical protein